MSPAAHLAVLATPFTTLPNPGPLPPRPANIFPQQWKDVKATQKRGLYEYTTYNNLDKAVKQQIIKAIVDPIFLKSLVNYISGYSRVTAHAMIQFLFNSYGNITPLQLDENDKMMKEQWDPSTPIIYLFAKIQEGVDKADAGNAPYTVDQVLAIACNHVFRTGTMQNACERWTTLNQTHKAWTHFQTMFVKAHETYKALTTQAGGYHGANSAYNMAPTTQSESFYTETADAFANLAMAATADKYLLSTLTSTNATLPGILREKYTLISKLQAQLRNTNTANPTTTNTAKTNYCWSHGTRVSKSHTSEACLYPKEGHKKEATRVNRIDGKDA
jgi:hypothetical protein